MPGEPRIDRITLTYETARRPYEPHAGDLKVVKGVTYVRDYDYVRDGAGRVMGRSVRRGKPCYVWRRYDENNEQDAQLVRTRVALHGRQRPFGQRRKKPSS